MRKYYKTPRVEEMRISQPQNLLETLSAKGTIEDWQQEDTEMEEFV